eukprot:Skav203297  [mRNA]  locus=scaffold2189:80538:84952:+ [translate_table: standard]
MASRASTADTYSTYYHCRLTEVTSRHLRQSFPRLTSAQASLRQRGRGATGSSSLPDLVQEEAKNLSPEEADEISKKKFMHSFSSVQEDSVSHWQEKENSGNMLASKLKSKLAALGTMQLPSIHKNPFAIEETISDDKFTAERMVTVLQDSRFFKDLDAAVLETLPKHAKFLSVPNGGVLFRQGDPAKGCYIIVSGKVGFYAGANSNTPRQPPTEMNETIPEAARRVYTYEGFSTFSKVSEYGNCVKRSGTGEVFGELALMGGAAVPRKATARCLDESELLFVSAEGFEEVKELEQQKREGFCEEVKKVAGHSSGNCFHQERHQKDTLLLRQGAAEESVVYVIINGTVELLRHSRGAGVDLLATLETGQIFGTFGRELKMPFSAKVATKTCEVLSARESLGGTPWNDGDIW